MILQLRQMHLTEAITFMTLLRKDELLKLLGAEDDTTFGQIVRCQLHRDFVARQNADVVHTHLSGDMPEYDMAVLEFDSECCIGQVFLNFTLHFYHVFF